MTISSSLPWLQHIAAVTRDMTLCLMFASAHNAHVRGHTNRPYTRFNRPAASAAAIVRPPRNTSSLQNTSHISKTARMLIQAHGWSDALVEPNFCCRAVDVQPLGRLLHNLRTRNSHVRLPGFEGRG